MLMKINNRIRIGEVVDVSPHPNTLDKNLNLEKGGAREMPYQPQPGRENPGSAGEIRKYKVQWKSSSHGLLHPSGLYPDHVQLIFTVLNIPYTYDQKSNVIIFEAEKTPELIKKIAGEIDRTWPADPSRSFSKAMYAAAALFLNPVEE
jgi:hypothetical protein